MFSKGRRLVCALAILYVSQGCTRNSSEDDSTITHEVSPEVDTVIATDYAKVAIKQKTFGKNVNLEVRDLKDVKTFFPDLSKAKPLGYGIVIKASGADTAAAHGLTVTLSAPGSVSDIDRNHVYVVGVVTVDGTEIRFSIAPDQLFITDADLTDGEYNIVFTTPKVPDGVYVAVYSESGVPSGYPDSREVNFDPKAKIAGISFLGPEPFLPEQCSGIFTIKLLDAKQNPIAANQEQFFKIVGVQEGEIYRDGKCQNPLNAQNVAIAKGQRNGTFYYKGNDDLRTWQLSAEMNIDGKLVKDTWRSRLSERPEGSFTEGYFVYDESSWDGKVKGSNSKDQNAVAPGKIAFRFYETQASVKNISSYIHGINGIALDVRQLNYPVTLSDFTFRVGARRGDQTIAIDPTTWSVAPQPSSIEVKWGQGVDESDRIFIFWTNGAIRDQWLQVKLLANAQTGLTDDEVIYFGHLTGDANGDGYVNAIDLGMMSESMGDPARIDTVADFDRDGHVDSNDQLIYQNAVGVHEILLLNRTEPVLESIRVASSGWTENYLNAHDAEFGEGRAIDLEGSSVPIGHPNLDRFTIRFSEPVVIPEAGLILLGSQVASYGDRFSNIQVSGETMTFNLTSPIGVDKLKMMFEGWTDELGNPLKGNHDSGRFQVRFDIAPCDINLDGRVLTSDLFDWQACNGSFAGDANYDVNGDLNGDGACNNSDLELWQAFFNQNLNNVEEP